MRFPSLNQAFYNELALRVIAKAIGNPIKVNRNTLAIYCSLYARVSVEVNLDEPLIGKVDVEGKIIHVAYEGLHMMCMHCVKFRHLQDRSPARDVPSLINPGG